MSDPQERGFIRVGPADGAHHWLTCNSCGKSDQFLLTSQVECRCGATYDRAVTPSGEQVEADKLAFVDFSEGPAHLADLELDPRKIGVLALAVVLLIASWWFVART